MEEKERRQRNWFLGSLFLFSSLFLISLFVHQQGSWFCNQRYIFGLLEPNIIIFLLTGGLFVGLGTLFFIRYQFFGQYEQLALFVLLASGGANLVERIYFGCVVDYWVLPVVGSSINIADVLITISVVWLLFFGKFNKIH
jgi:lipoprotein signal peptidase